MKNTKLSEIDQAVNDLQRKEDQAAAELIELFLKDCKDDSHNAVGEMIICLYDYLGKAIHVDEDGDLTYSNNATIQCLIKALSILYVKSDRQMIEQRYLENNLFTKK